MKVKVLANVVVGNPHLLGEVLPWNWNVPAQVKTVRDKTLLVDAALPANRKSVFVQFALFTFEITFLIKNK